MQMHVTGPELMVVFVMILLAFFWLIPTLVKGIVRRLRRIFGGSGSEGPSPGPTR